MKAEAPALFDTLAALPVVPRIVTSYTHIAECVLDSQHYYLPAQSTNALFDAFFVQVTKKKVTIWVLQFAIVKEHRGAQKGLDILTELCAKVAAEFGTRAVTLNYVLVIPSTSAAVRWKMPQGWGELSGDVWALYLDFVVMPCKPLYPKAK